MEKQNEEKNIPETTLSVHLVFILNSTKKLYGYNDELDAVDQYMRSKHVFFPFIFVFSWL